MERRCGTLQRCPIEVFVSVPPLGAQRNTRRYDVTIRGDGWRGLLESDRTRIPGLVAIEDIGETVRALERGDKPPIEARPTATAAPDLASSTSGWTMLDGRRGPRPGPWRSS